MEYNPTFYALDDLIVDSSGLPAHIMILNAVFSHFAKQSETLAKVAAPSELPKEAKLEVRPLEAYTSGSKARIVRTSAPLVIEILSNLLTQELVAWSVSRGTTSPELLICTRPLTKGKRI